MNTKFCTSCGKEINSSENFCTSCGAKNTNTVNDYSVNNYSASDYPINNYSANDYSVNNYTIDEKPVSLNPNNPRSGKKTINNDTLKLIGVCSCVALLIAICVVVFNFILRPSGKPSSENNASPQVSAPAINPPDSLPEDENLPDNIEHNDEIDDISIDEDQQDSGIDPVFNDAGADRDFILAFSSERALTDADLQGLSAQELRIARNEIFARHGRMFANQQLSDWFNSKEWYQSITPKYTPDEFNSLNPYPLSRLENDNIQKIIDYEG